MAASFKSDSQALGLGGASEMFRNEVLYHSPAGDVLIQTSELIPKAKTTAWVTYPLANNIAKLDDRKTVICKVISCFILQVYSWWKIQLQAPLFSETPTSYISAEWITSSLVGAVRSICTTLTPQIQGRQVLLVTYSPECPCRVGAHAPHLNRLKTLKFPTQQLSITRCQLVEINSCLATYQFWFTRGNFLLSSGIPGEKRTARFTSEPPRTVGLIQHPGPFQTPGLLTSLGSF